MAAGIEDLGLPSLAVPDLFRPHKIVIPSGSYAPPHGITPGNSRQSSVDNSNNTVGSAAILPGEGEVGIDLLLGGKATHSPAGFRRYSLPSSQSFKPRLAQMAEDRCSTPELDSSDCSTSSDTSEPAPISDSPYLSPLKMKHVNPKIVEFIYFVNITSG
jgi:hypothetical protein